MLKSRMVQQGRGVMKVFGPAVLRPGIIRMNSGPGRGIAILALLLVICGSLAAYGQTDATPREGQASGDAAGVPPTPLAGMAYSTTLFGKKIDIPDRNR